MKKIIQHTACGLLLVSISSTVYPINMNTAHLLTGAVGVGSAVGSYALCKAIKVPWPCVWALLTGAGASAVSYFVFYSMTPEGRLDRAREKIERICRHPIAMQAFDNEKVFFAALQEAYVTDALWLIGAYNQLSNLLNETRESIELLQLVRSEAADNYMLMQQCNVLSPRARTALVNITEAVKMIRNNKEYITQYNTYQQQIQAEKQLQVQRDIARTQKVKAYAQLETAQAQKEKARAQRDMADIKGIKTAIELSR